MHATALLAAALAGPVTMPRPADVGPGIAGFPRVARPATAAQRRINAAVARLDGRVTAAAVIPAAVLRREGASARLANGLPTARGTTR